MSPNTPHLGNAFARPEEPTREEPVVLIPTIFHAMGDTGVHTHMHELVKHAAIQGATAALVTPFSGNRLLAYAVFSPRHLLKICWKSAGVVWYRHWHEVFLYRALRRQLTKIDDCIIYAQGPLEAHAALRARSGDNQRVIMAVHFRISQADEHAEPGREIRRDGRVFRSIRKLEKDVILKLTGIVYISEWARKAVYSWLPEAADVPSAVIPNFVHDVQPSAGQRLGDLVTVGKLELRKNHGFLLDVLAAARDAGHSFTLDVFGQGELWEDLHRRAVDMGLAEQVRFHGFRRDVRNFLPKYRAYVHAALAEGLPLAIIEAMAAGLPILAGNIGPVAEMCEDGVEARLLPLDDPAAAADQLIELLDSDVDYQLAAKAARDRFCREFDASVVGPQLWSFLTSPRASNATQPS